jgi:hypothetical protein
LVTLPVDLISTAYLTNLLFTLTVPPGRIDNLWFQATAAAANLELTVPDPARSVVSLEANSGLWFHGTQTVARIWFDIPPAHSPGFANLVVQGASAREINGTLFTNIVASRGRIVVTTGQPLLEAVPLGQEQLRLNLFGQPGLTFDLQTTSKLPGAWSTAAILTLTNTIEFVDWTNRVEPALFFRLKSR